MQRTAAYCTAASAGTVVILLQLLTHSLEEGGHSILPIYPVLQCFQMVQLGMRRFLLNSFGENLRDTSGNTMSENA